MKSELNRVRQLKAALKALEQQRLNLLTTAEDLVPITDGMPHSTGVKSKVETLGLRILQVDEQITEAKKKIATAEVDLTEKIIAKIRNPRIQQVAILRYAACLSYREIAHQTHFTLRYIYMLHKKFLEKFQ